MKERKISANKKLISIGGKEVFPGTKLALLRIVMSKTTYIRRKSKGLCVNCGEKAMLGKVMCAKCAEKQRIDSQERRTFLRNLGFCPRCGKNKLFGNEKNCPECLAVMYEVNTKSKEQRQLLMPDYSKKYYQNLKENGICCDCKKRKAAEGHIYCQNCLAKRREDGRIYRRKREDGLARSERPSYGLCYTCGKPLDREGRVCQSCADKMTKNLPDKRSNVKWRIDNEIVFKNT